MKVGCGRFAVARERYFAELPTVEIGPAFIDPMKPATAETWRREAPKDFDFSVPASQVVTHTSESSTYNRIRAKIPERRRAFCGHFRDTPEVALAWEATQALAVALRARFVVFDTPATFYPDANHLRDMYRFFKSMRRGPWTLVWQPRGSWQERMVLTVCRDLGLVRALDPLKDPEPETEGVRYYRLPGQGYTDAQLSSVRRAAARGQSYLYFTHPRGWLEAKRLVTGRAR